MRKLVPLALLLSGCAHVPLSTPDAILSDDQTVDLMEHTDRWLGRTVTLRIYPFDNGFRESYVACLEKCDKAGADRSIFVVYTKADRFKGYRGDRPEIVKAEFRKICPEQFPVCLDAPIRVYALREME